MHLGNFILYKRTMLLAVLSALTHQEVAGRAEYVQTLIVKATRPSPVKAFLKR
jgi:hypothetical protein